MSEAPEATPDSGPGDGAARRPVGRVAAIHRYPVKSMRGEALDVARLGPRGVPGDRAWALLDVETGRVVSAKRPRRWAGILDFEARFEREPATEREAPPVAIRLPDGSLARSEAPEAAGSRLSAALGREVRLASVAPEGAAFEYHWPDMEGLAYRGRTFRDEITEHELLPGSFFDGAWLHLLTTASLDHLRRLAPDGDFAARRFRPNLVIETRAGRTGFVENAWVGACLSIGDEARIDVTEPCFRCVMTTVAQSDLPKDPAILRAAFDHNGGNVGVKAEVRAAGRIAVDDPVYLEA